MSLPAVVLAGVPGSQEKVAAVTVLDRLVVSLHRAGCAPLTLVSAGTPPALKRARALGIEWQSVPEVPSQLEGPLLLAQGNVLAHRNDIARIVEAGGQLATAKAELLPLGVADRAGTDVTAALRGRTHLLAKEAAALVTDPGSARRAAKALWKSLVSSADGPMDKLVNRRLGRPLSKLLIHTPVTPNQVTLFAMFVGLLGAWLFAQGSYSLAIWGALVFQLSAIIDCVDGDVARCVYKETATGKWIDIVADQVVHLSLFAAIAVGLSRAGSEAPVLLLGASAAAGALLSFLVVLRGMLAPEDKRNPKLAKLIDTATNRDFSYLLIVLAALGRLELFLWMAAIGAHVFWILALAIQLAGTRSAGSQESAA